MIIYLVRHGQTDWNAELKVQGVTDIPLNETGLAQAAKARELMKDIPLDVIYSSPLARAWRTAEIINEYHHVPLIAEPRIMERNYGIYEAKHYDEYPGVEFWNYDLNKRFEGAETVQEVFGRIYACLDEIRAKHPGKSVMLAMHGGAARAVHVYFNGFPAGGTLKSLVTPNAEPIRFEIADDAPLHTAIPLHAVGGCGQTEGGRK